MFYLLCTKELKDTFYNVCRMYIDNLLNIGNVTDTVVPLIYTLIWKDLVTCGLKVENKLTEYK